MKPEECSRECEAGERIAPLASTPVCADKPSPLGWTRHPLMKWPGCPQYRQTLSDSLRCLSERVQLARPSCMGSMTVADRSGVDVGSIKLTVGLLGAAREVGGREWLNLDPCLLLSEAIVRACCEGDQSLEVWYPIWHSQFCYVPPPAP